MVVKRFAVSLPENIARSLEENLEEMVYDNRSKAVTEAVKRFLEDKKDNDIEVGSLIIKAEKKSGRVKSRLDSIKNHYESAIISSSRESSKKRFVDVWVVKGKKCHLTRLRNRISKVDGIISCWLNALSMDQAGKLFELKIREILDEDIGAGDITSYNVIPEGKRSNAVIVAKEDGIICGVCLIDEIFKTYDDRLKVEIFKKDGEKVKKGEIIAKIKGPARSIFACERSVLNSLMCLSGISTITAKFVERIKPHKAILLDTRKTIPAYRIIEKYAVKAGGGENHRMGLFDRILVKSNHVIIAGSLKEAIRRARSGGKPIMVEVTNIDELKEALDMDVERILLDNMSIEDMKKAVKITNGRAKLEASGGITLDNIEEVAATGVDFISVGSALTLSFDALDFSLEIVG